MNRIVIFGASSGLGRELALQYAQYNSAKLVLVARRETLLNQVRNNALNAGATSVNIITADVTKIEDMTRTMDHISEILDCVDILIINAGIYRSVCIMETDFNKMATLNNELLETNYWGVINVLKAAIPHIRNKWQSSTRVVVTSSILALSALRDHPIDPYSTLFASSKAAVEGFIKSIRREETFPLLIAYPTYICNTEHYNTESAKPAPNFENFVSVEDAAYAYRFGIEKLEQEIFFDDCSKASNFYHALSNDVYHFLQCFISQPIGEDSVNRIPPKFAQFVVEQQNKPIDYVEDVVKKLKEYVDSNSTINEEEHDSIIEKIVSTIN